MKLTCFILTLLIFTLNVRSQNDTTTNTSFYIYQTEDDFFAGKKRFIGNYYEISDYIKYKDITNEKKKMKLGDSTFFAYQAGSTKYIRPYAGTSYYAYCGGKKGVYMLAPFGCSFTYDESGWAKSFSCSEQIVMYSFIDIKRDINTVRIEKLLDEEEGEKFKAEYKSLKGGIWHRNKLAVYTKYLKKYCQTH